MKIYGPYLRKDGRKHIIYVNEDGDKRTQSYPRFLMEQHLGRKLSDAETVDHINNDYTDNRIENLQILSRVDNAKKEMAREERKEKLYVFKCPYCGNEATKRLKDVKHNRKQHKLGPFCGRSCARKASYVNPWRDR